LQVREANVNVVVEICIDVKSLVLVGIVKQDLIIVIGITLVRLMNKWIRYGSIWYFPFGIFDPFGIYPFGIFENTKWTNTKWINTKWIILKTVLRVERVKILNFRQQF